MGFLPKKEKMKLWFVSLVIRKVDDGKKEIICNLRIKLSKNNRKDPLEEWLKHIIILKLKLLEKELAIFRLEGIVIEMYLRSLLKSSSIG